MPSATTLTAEHLSKSFSGPPLFRDLSISIAGGFVGVAGRNGSGKTTLLKILAGLARPTSGGVRLEREGRPLPEPARRLAIGWSGPDLELYGELTAEENLLFFRRAAGRPEGRDEARRRLRDCGLSEEALGRRVAEFSTGMRQRLRLAFATLFDPDVLLLDEPANGLDAEGRAILSAVIERARRRGAVVLASNDERDLAGADQRVELGR
ncbi:MAG TPA: ABC transporter ATP-binding protein [Thermoanaerobaculia bacterium]|nr:ABC transporter ATP-binding protein [Thermoanaerobaculia bacterium]